MLVNVGLAAPVPTVTDAAGFASLHSPLPALPQWIGVQIFAQAVVLDPSVALGFTLSGGIAALLGE